MYKQNTFIKIGLLKAEVKDRLEWMALALSTPRCIYDRDVRHNLYTVYLFSSARIFVVCEILIHTSPLSLLAVYIRMYTFAKKTIISQVRARL